MSGNGFTNLYDKFFPDNPDEKKISANENKSNTYVLTIQILFGIIIGISFTDYYKELVPFEFNFETVLIFVAYSTALLSLVGYSITIKYRYHRNFLRFGLDMFLLYLYYQLVYSPQISFDYFLSIFPLIFGVYCIWQCLEYLEWRKDKDNPYKIKEFKKLFFGTIGFFVVFLLISFFYNGIISIEENFGPDNILNYWPVTSIEILILGGIIFLLIGFRIFVSLIESTTK